MSYSKRKKKKVKKLAASFIFLVVFTLVAYYQEDISKNFLPQAVPVLKASYAMDGIPAYDKDAYVFLNNNQPNFTEEDMQKTTFESYSELDSLNRCGPAFALVSKETMPKEERGSIGMIKPSGWHTVKYDNVDGKYLYNRCHLIGFQLTGENANPKNLITCTRQMNAKTMLEFENQVADYVKKTNHHVLYRVTPYFEGDNLVATGVQMEAKSQEDNGKDLSFNVFVYNIQDGIQIDYKTGESSLKQS